MEQPVAAIEFGSKKMKLVVGYELQGKVYVLYSLVKPYGRIIEYGNFIDTPKLIQSVSEIKQINDASAKLHLNIGDSLLALPPYGLQIFNTRQVTTVISEEGRIGQLDLKNIYSLIKNSSAPLNSELIDIIPEVFILDQGRTSALPPIGQNSSTLTVQAKVHTLPKHIGYDYQTALINGGINVKKCVVAPFAIAELIATEQEYPTDYFLCDIGSGATTVSLVGDKQLFDSRYIEWGGDRITERIIEQFNVGEEKAEKIKFLYGIDKREMNFKAPVCSYFDADGNEIQYFTSDLNVLIKKELEIFVKSLNETINSLIEGYPPNFKGMPMILSGGGAQLKGLVEYVEAKIPCEYIKIFTPKNLGARNPTFTNCLGMILVHSHYPNAYDDNHIKINKVTRESVEGGK